MKHTVIITTSEETEEIRSLLKTLDIEVVKEYVQKRSLPHKVSFFGPGKIDEILEETKSLTPDFLTINGTLKPSQHHFLEMKFQMECVDRTGVILRIFSDHAHTPEAIAQVTLAKLRYELPFLREWIHKAKSGDRPGFLSGGAYATDVYFEHAKSHVRRIEKDLKDLSKQREIKRAMRRETGYSLVSLAGYTNAGKSALFNRLCDASVEVDDRLFSTLSTTTRRLKGIKGSILISDTVGFIRDLPPNLVDAFNSTLEEIFYADMILLVFDCSEDDDVIKSKLSTSLNILMPKVGSRCLVIVGNKIDLVAIKRRQVIEGFVKLIVSPYDVILISTVSSERLDTLKNRISRIQGFTCTIDATLPLVDRSFSYLSDLHSTAQVSERVVHDHLAVTIRCKPDDCDKILGKLDTLGAKVLSRDLNPANDLVQKEKGLSGNEGVPL
jgi:GTP-binding protein HflX